MKINRIIYIFIALITLSLVGCGSSNNPASSGNVSSGMVKVSGNVKNLSGDGSVSFYTPKAAVSNGLNVATTFRASVANDGVYRFDTDENGNYSGQIPAGEYYVVAQNSDGTMKSVSEKQSITSARAATSETYDFTLNKTVNIIGRILNDYLIDDESSDDSSSGNTDSIILNANIPVYIEGLPFVAITDSNGNFKFNSVPVITDSTTYNIKSSIYFDKYTVSASKKLTKSDFSSGGDLQLEPMKFDMTEIMNIEGQYVQGIVFQNGTTNGIAGVIVVALSDTGNIMSAITDESGEYAFLVIDVVYDKNIQISADMMTYEEAVISDTYIDYSNSKGTPSYSNVLYVGGGDSPIINDYGISITEKYDAVFKLTSENTLTVFGPSPTGSGEIEYLSEGVYQELNNYKLGNLESGKSYHYMLTSRNLVEDSYGFRFSNFVDAANPFNTIESTDIIEFKQPYISINNGIYTANITQIKKGNVSISASAYAIGENSERKTLTVNSDNSIKLNSITEAGVYDIYLSYIVSFGGMKATVTSDPCPYVKH
jgi:hypothetical protein